MKVFFYTPELEFYNQIHSEQDLIPHTANGLGCWIHQAGFYLAKYSQSIVPEVVNYVPEEGIIVFHKGFFPRTIRPTSSQYFVCIQADYGRHRYAHMHIVQNADQIANAKVSKQSVADRFFSFTSSLFLPLWLQPALIERSQDRGSKIENVSFFGNPEQFPANEIALLTEGLEKRGLQLQLKLTPDTWTDYSNTDITLALRSFGRKPYYHKPISKLVNAVLCNSLLIAGDESSSWYFRKKYYPELPIISSAEELLKAVDTLRANPESAFAHVQACKTRLADINTISLVREWESMLELSSGFFQRWQKLNPVSRELFFSLRSV
jgi:hypothetical protein